MRRTCYLALTLICMLGNSLGATASDLEREQRIHDQIVDAIFDGEPLTLNAAGHEFLAIHMMSEAEKKKGAVILLHGRGLHPDQTNIVPPLRVGLAERGWDTLALQMPVLGKEAKYYDYVPILPEAHPRIEAAITFLRKQGVKRIVLIAHSCGAHMAMSWVRKTGDGAIDAYVGIGMGATDYKQPMREPFPLDKMKVPLFDIYGSDDYPAVLRMAPERKAKINRAGNPQSAQQVIAGADHYFGGHNEELVEAVADWLDDLRF